jgi:hypothetical protein
MDFHQKSTLFQMNYRMEFFMKSLKLFMIWIFIPVLAAGCSIKPVQEKPAVTRPTIPVQAVTAQTAPATTRMYLIALEDGGKSGPAIGCGDSLVAVDLPVNDLKLAVRQLLDNRARLYGQSGLYNALYQSDLQLNSIERTNEGISANLTGKLVLGGECDNPRVKAQLEATLRQSTDTRIPVTIRVNRDLLDDLLSGK